MNTGAIPGSASSTRASVDSQQSPRRCCRATRAFTITGPTATTPTGPVYAFNDTAEYTGDFNDGLTGVTNYDSYGAYFDISLIAESAEPRIHHPQHLDGCERSRARTCISTSQHDTRRHGQSQAIAMVFTTTPTPAQILDSLTEHPAGLLDRPPAGRHPAAVRCRAAAPMPSTRASRAALSVTHDRHHRRHRYSAYARRQPDRR